jgi:SAM-dependent methyltransferase
MKAGFVRDLLGRSDYAIIGDIVEPRTKVLDLGCGEGELLEWLASNKGVDARGVEISSAKVRKAIACGVSVFQCDIDEGLADYPDQAFDYVILSQTLQESAIRARSCARCCAWPPGDWFASAEFREADLTAARTGGLLPVGCWNVRLS